jgi:hypothetical protein
MDGFLARISCLSYIGLEPDLPHYLDGSDFGIEPKELLAYHLKPN